MTWIRLAADDTWRWANQPGAAWPCSTLAGHRIDADVDSDGDLVDLYIDGKYPDADEDWIDGYELSCMLADVRNGEFRPEGA